MSAIKHEFQADIDAFVNSEIKTVIGYNAEHGEIFPHVSMLFKLGNEIDVFVYPVPPFCLNGEYGKELLTRSVIPAMLAISKYLNMQILCLCWISEAFMWDADVSDMPNGGSQKVDIEEIKKRATKRDVILLSFETAYSCKPVMLERVDKKLIRLDEIEAPEIQVEGRFTNLLNREFTFEKSKN